MSNRVTSLRDPSLLCYYHVRSFTLLSLMLTQRKQTAKKGEREREKEETAELCRCVGEGSVEG